MFHRRENLDSMFGPKARTSEVCGVLQWSEDHTTVAPWRTCSSCGAEPTSRRQGWSAVLRTIRVSVMTPP